MFWPKVLVMAGGSVIFAFADWRFTAQTKGAEPRENGWISLFNEKYLTDDIVLNVRTRKGRFIGLTITGQDWIGGDGIMHESDRVPLDFPIPEDISGGFAIPVNQNVTIHRLRGHLGGPRVEEAGVIHIGELMYSPCILGSNCLSSGNNDYPDHCLPP